MSRLCQCAASARAPPPPVPPEEPQPPPGPLDPLLSELSPLPLSALIERARALESKGVAREQLWAAVDSPSPREAVAQLVAKAEVDATRRELLAEEQRARQPAAEQRRTSPVPPPPEPVAELEPVAEPQPQPQPQEPEPEPEEVPAPAVAPLAAPVPEYFCSGCSFKGTLEVVTAHEITCRNAFFCDNKCGFSGNHDAVVAHERICPKRPSGGGRGRGGGGGPDPGSYGPPSPVPPTAAERGAFIPACEKAWSEMLPPEQAACATLGWSESSWEAADQAPMRKIWERMSAAQTAAAYLMGFNDTDFEQ